MPSLAILLTQFIVALAVNLLVVFRLMGRSYDAAVICAGLGGIALGFTPTAMADIKHNRSDVAVRRFDAQS